MSEINTNGIMKVLRCCYFFRQTILIILSRLTHAWCKVQLTSSALVCGEPAVLNCTVIPFDGIRWRLNSAALLDCYSAGLCDFPMIGNMSFSVDVPLSTYTLTINPLEYSVHQNDVFQCSDHIDDESLTLDVLVPLTSFEINAKENPTAVFQLNAVTNCLKSTENVTFEWACTPVSANQTLSGTCNVSSVRRAVNTSSCDTENYCAGSGLQKQIDILTFENYTGSMDTEDVYLKVTAFSIDGTNLTRTFTETFKLKKISVKWSTRTDNANYGLISGIIYGITGGALLGAMGGIWYRHIYKAKPWKTH